MSTIARKTAGLKPADLWSGRDFVASLLDHISDAVLVVDTDTTVRYANAAALRLLGRRPQELLGMSVLLQVHPDDAEAVSKALTEPPGGSRGTELRFRCGSRADGRWRHAIGTISSSRDGPHIKGLVFDFRDATGRPRTNEGVQRPDKGPENRSARPMGAVSQADDQEGLLRENPARPGAIVEQATVAIAQVGVDGSIVTVDQRLCELLRYTEEELLGIDLRDLTHPEDLEAEMGNMSRLLAARGDTYSAEKRYLKKDGSLVWVDQTVSLVRDPVSDAPKYFVYFIEDKNWRKRAEATIEQSERLYRAVVEQAAEHVFLVDAQNKRVLEANAAFHRSLGYSSEEARGMTLYDFVAQDRKEIDHDFRRILGEGRCLVGERRYRCKDGSLVDVEVNASTIAYGDGEAVCIVAHDVTERKKTERELRQSVDSLLAIYETGRILGSTLEAEEIGSRLLRLMQHISGAATAVFSMPDEHRQQRVWRAIGLENLQRRIRYTPAVQDAMRTVMSSGEYTSLDLEHSDPAAETLPALFLPLKIRSRTIGALEVYGPNAADEKGVVSILLNLTTTAASALENARLYGELAEREHRLQELVGKLIATQEEERRRVAYEVHDGPTQVAIAAYQHLQAFVREYPPDSPEQRRALEPALELAQRTVRESRAIIANLRPTALDDLGLAVAIRLQVDSLRDEGWQVGYEENLANMRLPDTIETPLYRVAQEALMNVRKHGQTTRARVRLRDLGEKIRLQVRDWGVGFESIPPPEGGPGERVGLASMRERIALVGGALKVHSKVGLGTLITADVPLLGEHNAGEAGAAWQRSLFPSARPPAARSDG